MVCEEPPPTPEKLFHQTSSTTIHHYIPKKTDSAATAGLLTDKGHEVGEVVLAVLLVLSCGGAVGRLALGWVVIQMLRW